MAFTGKATYDSGTTLPETHEDITDLVGIVSPFETPFLNFIGDSDKPAQSTVHEWIEDALNPRTDAINGAISNTTDTTVSVDTGTRFRVGDQIIIEDKTLETMLVTAISTNDLTVTRGYGSTTASTHADNAVITIVSSSELEGADAGSDRSTTRARESNFTQIFEDIVNVSGSMQSVNNVGIQSEIDYQTSNRLRELTRQLEGAVIAGHEIAANPEGSSTIRRTMSGLMHYVSTNKFQADTTGAFSGTGTALTEPILNLLLKQIWDVSGAPTDYILVNGHQKRQINGFITPVTRFAPSDRVFENLVDVYDSDYGRVSVILTRWVPPHVVVAGSKSKIKVMPLAGRSFQRFPLGKDGDSDRFQVVGEYTTEIMNEATIGMVWGLDTA